MAWLVGGVLLIGALILWAVTAISRQIEGLGNMILGAATEIAACKHELRKIEEHSARQTRELDNAELERRRAEREIYP